MSSRLFEGAPAADPDEVAFERRVLGSGWRYSEAFGDYHVMFPDQPAVSVWESLKRGKPD